MQRHPFVICIACGLAATGCTRRVVEETAKHTLVPELERRIEEDLHTQFVEFFAGHGLRLDFERRSLAFDAVVAVDSHDPETPDVYLEVICCTPDTREHESLVVTLVRPSMVHAALEALGATAGAPGSWRVVGQDVERTAPAGDLVEIRFECPTLPDPPPTDPAEWITRGATGPTLREVLPDSAWVFAGSVMRERQGRTRYDADGTGALIGLHTFGSETIAWTRVESHESALDEPLWLANDGIVPAIGTPVVVRLRLEQD